MPDRSNSSETTGGWQSSRPAPKPGRNESPPIHGETGPIEQADSFYPIHRSFPAPPSSARRKSILQNQAGKDEEKEVEKDQCIDGNIEISTLYHTLSAFSFRVADRGIKNVPNLLEEVGRHSPIRRPTDFPRTKETD